MLYVFTYVFIFITTILFVYCDICTDTICEYKFDVQLERTMTYKPDKTKPTSYEVALNGSDLQIVSNSVGLETDSLIGKIVDPDNVITGDGTERRIYTINGQFPGPTIEVMEGSQVSIKVTNNLPCHTLTIHWHGIHQVGTPWMDGTGYITQCPILSGQSFTYHFTATPAGTHWYHSHIESQRLDGIFGALIVHRKPPEITHFPVTAMDYFHSDNEMVMLLNAGTPEMTRHASHMLHMADNSADDSHHNMDMSSWMHSIIINGRGRHTRVPFPLETFSVAKNDKYRFYMIHSGTEHALLVSIDGHRLTIVALDGGDIPPIEVDSFYIAPGETVDFEVTAEADVGSYWFRAAEVMLHGHIDDDDDDDDHDHDIEDVTAEEGTSHTRNVGLAILRYQGSSLIEPSSTKKQCSEQHKCKVFNCFSLPGEDHEDCVTLNDVARNQTNSEIDSFEVGLKEKSFFFNWVFSTSVNYTGSSVNGRKFVVPKVPFYQERESDCDVVCDEEKCTQSGCACTYVVDIPYDDTVFLVYTNMQPTQTIFAHHPIHIHGHTLEVLKIGYASKDPNTGKMIQNPDIGCNNELCTDPYWVNIPTDLNLQNPPLKDTVVVPVMGYVVLRMRTKNPGSWFLHCHTQQHVVDGMAVVLNVATEQALAPPAGFPTCNEFNPTREDVNSVSQTMSQQAKNADHIIKLDCRLVVGGAFILIGFSVICTLLTINLIRFWSKKRLHNGHLYTDLTSEK